MVRIEWEAQAPYDEIGGREAVEGALRDALAAVPREHLRQLDGVVAMDSDPRGRNLGLYVRDHAGFRIEVYLEPHVRDALWAPERARLWMLRLHLAHTLFHEVGHHMTLTLNRRQAPSRKRAQVNDTLEKWAEEYVRKRMEKYVASIEGDSQDIAIARACLQRLGF